MGGHDLCFQNADFSMEVRAGLNDVFQANYQPLLSDMIITFSLICPQPFLDVTPESQADQHLLTLHAGTGTDVCSRDIMTRLLLPPLLLGPAFGVFIPSKERKVSILLIS